MALFIFNESRGNKKKINFICTSEYNNKKYTNLKKIEDSIKNKMDLFDRPILYEKNTFDKTFPDYVVNNKEKLKTGSYNNLEKFKSYIV